MLKLLTIIGARPQIIKAAALSRAIRTKFANQITEVIVHTGQHYDDNMSKVFFDELNIPSPHYNLNTGSGAHGKQTASMIAGIEDILLKEVPSCIILYGDTNSTLAGAIAASKLNIPVVHIEAGLRSFNKSMPEEINRILCDHVSTLLFSPTNAGIENLIREGFKENNHGPYSADNPRIWHCGDIMYDNSLYFSTIAKSGLLAEYGLTPGKFLLSTIHRNHNTDEPARLNSIFSALQDISEKANTTIVLPLHPRTAKLLSMNLDPALHAAIMANSRMKIIPPVSFLDMIILEKNASLVLTDSGGVQKEAFFFRKPCVILRPETEWVELTACGAAILADADTERIVAAYHHFASGKEVQFPPLFGDGYAAEFICQQILTNIPERKS